MKEQLRGIFPINKNAYIEWDKETSFVKTENETFIAEREVPEKNVTFKLVGYLSENGDVWYSILPFPIDMPKFKTSESTGWDTVRKEMLKYTQTTKKKNLKQIMVETGMDVFDFSEKGGMEMVGEEVRIINVGKVNREELLTDIARREGVWSEALLKIRDAAREMQSIKVASKEPSSFNVESVIFQSAYEIAISSGIPHHIALNMASETCEATTNSKKGQDDASHKGPESIR
jgi:hypothetical protein